MGTQLTKNPLRTFVYVSILILVVDTAEIAYTSVETAIEGHSTAGKLFYLWTLARMACLVLFLVLNGRSKYAWHFLLGSLMVSAGEYSLAGLKGDSDHISSVVMYGAIGIGLIVYLILLRGKYNTWLTARRVDMVGSEDSPKARVDADNSLVSGEPTISAIDQLTVGKIGAACVAIYAAGPIAKHVSAKGLHVENVGFVLVLVFFLGVPLTYGFSLIRRKVVIAYALWRVWLGFIILFFVLQGFRELVLEGDTRRLYHFWLPLIVATLMMEAGVQGARRLYAKAKQDTRDTASHIGAWVAGFIGFCYGGKLAHLILRRLGSDMPSYDIRWVIASLAGATFLGAVSAFLASVLVTTICVVYSDSQDDLGNDRSPRVK